MKKLVLHEKKRKNVEQVLGPQGRREEEREEEEEREGPAGGEGEDAGGKSGWERRSGKSGWLWVDGWVEMLVLVLAW